MNSFRKLQKRLQEEGWYVGWNEPCCQSCAWGCLPYEHEEGPRIGEDIDFDKVLFNHSQDCEVFIEGNECEACEGDGVDEDDNDCPICYGLGEIDDGFDISQYDTSVEGFICQSPEQQESSLFCFSGGKEGVENLKAILPIIKECGCDYYWDETGDSRIDISWSLD